jgi:hypothetical protein
MLKSPLFHLSAAFVTGVVALSGPVPAQQAAQHEEAPGALFHRIPGETQFSELYIGGYELGESETIWRYMCGSDTQGRTVADLQAIAALMEAHMSRPDVRVLDSGGREDGLNLIFFLDGSVPQDAVDAIQLAEVFIESKFADPVELAINIAYDNLGSGVLGATSSNYRSATYATARSSLYDGRDADDLLQALLPYGASIPVRYTGAATRSPTRAVSSSPMATTGP